MDRSGRDAARLGRGRNLWRHRNAAQHPTYCNVEGWGYGSFNVACYASTGAAVDTYFSFMISTGATRSGLVGGHAWVNGATSAPSSYQMVAPSIACMPGSPATVTGFSNVTYPDTGVETYYPTFPLTIAYGPGSSNYCKIGSWSTTGADTTVSTLCFTAGGAPTTTSFTQSLLASTYPGPC